MYNIIYYVVSYNCYGYIACWGRVNIQGQRGLERVGFKWATEETSKIRVFTAACRTEESVPLGGTGKEGIAIVAQMAIDIDLSIWVNRDLTNITTNSYLKAM